MPEEVEVKNKKYKLIKIYKNYALYEEIKTGFKECFTKLELGLIPQTRKPKAPNILK